MRRAPRSLLIAWSAAFVGFPIGGLVGQAVAGPADALWPALVSGAIAGAVIGLADGMAIGPPRRRLAAWAGLTGAGLGLGPAAAVALAGPPTSMASSMAAGALTGLVVGAVQAPLLAREGVRLAALWAPLLAVVWVVGWAVTIGVGVGLAPGWPVFGASGAIVAQVLSGIGLVLLAGTAERRAVTAR